MIEWWNNLSSLGQIFGTIAISATVILIIQSILLLFGIGFSSDADADSIDDFDGSDAADGGLTLFTVRGIVAFLSVGGFCGLLLTIYDTPAILSVFLSLVAGTIALFTIAIIFKYSMKLQSNGNLSIKNAIGKTGKVYIPIPENGTGFGKVNVLIQETLTELDAMTNDKTSLKTGEVVKIISTVDDQTLVVTKSRENTNNNTAQGGISKWIQ